MTGNPPRLRARPGHQAAFRIIATHTLVGAGAGLLIGFVLGVDQPPAHPMFAPIDLNHTKNPRITV
jgi:hypothetical protein